MTTHSGPNSETNSGASSPLFKIIQASYKFIGRKIKQANNLVKDYTELSVGAFAVIATVGVGWSSYNATLEAASMQANSTLEVAKITSLKTYVDGMNTLLISKENNVPNPTFEKEIEALLKSNSFQALRSLTDREKGTFVRFLAEKELIITDQPAISLAGADLRNIDLEDAWLPDVNLQRAYILDSNLVNINLTRANLSNAVLQRTDLTGAILTDTDFAGTDLTNARLDIDKAIQQGANFCNATMPDGSRGDCL